MVTEEKSDRPTLNEILASIRRITAEEHSPDLHPFPFDGVRMTPSQTTDRLDDFELPAMFRQERAPHTPPLGPISSLFDARDSSERGPGGVPPTPPPIDPLAPQSLMSDIRASDAQPRHAQTSSDVLREMSSCKDRVLARMGQPSPAEPKTPAPIRSPETKSIPKATLRVNYLVGAGSRLVDQEPEEAVVALSSLPPVLTRSESSMSAELATDGRPFPNPGDVADLLRPLLRQWLDVNITRVLTQALMDTVKRDDQRS
jgi:cell pole-organizing protein PopZ